MCVCLYVCVGVCCFRVLMYLCIHVHVCIRWMWCRGLFHRARICKWILQVWMFWSRYQLSSSSPPVACSVAYLQQVFFFHPLQWNSRICVCLCACVCVCVHVCVWPTTVCEPYKANQETFKDKKRCESLFSLICSEARKHPLLCPQWLPWGDIYIYCVSVCVCVSCSPQGYYLAPNEVPSYSHSPLSQEMWRAPGEQLVQCWRCRTVEERLRYLGL